jgi:1-acyl-sn-glycerol-3-phosphate acyltransferase
MATRAHPMCVLVAAVRSAAAYILVSLYILVAGLPTLTLGLFRSVEDLVYILSRIGVQLALVLSGIRVVVEGRERQPMGRGAVYCGNHESNVDAPILFYALHPRLHTLYKAEFGRIPVLGQVIKAARCVPVYRDDRDRSIRWLDEAVPMLAAGTPFLFFPEGTRSEPGTLLPFKKGGFIMAIRAQVPVVPVAMHGSYDAMARGSALIYPARISVRVGRPIETTGMTLDDRDGLIEQVRQRMKELLALGPIAARKASA